MGIVEPGMEAMLDVFVHETDTMLEELDEVLIVSEKAHNIDDDNINTIFRIPHTIKGSAAMMNFEGMSNLAHSIEDVFYILRDNPEKLKVVFVENYSVSIAEKLMPATDVSEQISLAGKEASGTGNMKFMMLGALTHATLDGANVEINDLVGNENMYLFGLRLNEVEQLNRQGYSAWSSYSSDWRIKRVFDDLVNGFIPNIYYEGRTVFDEILNNDVYYVTKDLPMYLESMNRIDEDWRNPYVWRKKAIINIANSGFFDINRNIEDYCNKVWFV